MNKLRDNDLYFIHIPKNAGTAFTLKFCESSDGHYKITEYERNLWEKTIAIVRNPYDRIISFYKYARMRKSYWHSDDNTTMYPLHVLYDYCNSKSIDEFVLDLSKGKFDEIKHLYSQIYWLITPDGVIKSKILRYENLEEEIRLIFGDLKLERVNESEGKEIKLSEESRELIYVKYEMDFKLLEYSK